MEAASRQRKGLAHSSQHGTFLASRLERPRRCDRSQRDDLSCPRKRGDRSRASVGEGRCRLSGMNDPKVWESTRETSRQWRNGAMT